MAASPDWVTTTHHWAVPVDETHLRVVRDSVADYGRGGVRHMILEVLAYANDEAESAGRLGTVIVVRRLDGTISITDDGRGTDTRRDPSGHIVRKPVMSTKDVRFFDNPRSPLLPDGLPRRGMSVTAALSSVLVHENHRTTGSWSQTYHHGIPVSELQERPGSPDKTGTTVTFTLDSELRTSEVLLPSDISAFGSLRVELRNEPLR